MKKIIVIILAILLCSSINSFSQDRSHKPGQIVKTQQQKNVKPRERHKSKKVIPRKRISRSGLIKHGPNKTSSAIRL